MAFYYVSTGQGCGIREGKNIRAAERSAIRESGTANFESIRPATKEDILWVLGMGGYIPDGAFAKYKLPK